MPNHNAVPYSQITEQYDAGHQQPTVLARRGNGDIVTAQLTADTDELGRRFVQYDTAGGPAKKALAYDSLTDDSQEQLASELAESRITSASQTEVTQTIETTDDDVEITRKRVGAGMAKSAINTSSWSETVPQAEDIAEVIDARAEVESAISGSTPEPVMEPADTMETEAAQEDQKSPESSDEKSDDEPSEGWQMILREVQTTMDSDSVRQLENTMRGGDISRASRALGMIEDVRDELIALMSKASSTDVARGSESAAVEGIANALRGPINILDSEYQQLEQIHRLSDQYDARTPGMVQAEDELRTNIISGIRYAKQHIDEAIQSQAKKRI
jgi:hypothetical protein